LEIQPTAARRNGSAARILEKQNRLQMRRQRALASSGPVLAQNHLPNVD
jgi:hypothetical protein